MDKTMLELFMRLLSGQQGSNINLSGNSGNPSQNNVYTNPSYANYPREAFAQSINNNSNNSGAQNNISTGNGDNNILPMLLSILGKNNNGLSSIFEALSKKPSSESQNDSHNETTGDSSPIDDEILL